MKKRIDEKYMKAYFLFIISSINLFKKQFARQNVSMPKLFNSYNITIPITIFFPMF